MYKKVHLKTRNLTNSQKFRTFNTNISVGGRFEDKAFIIISLQIEEESSLPELINKLLSFLILEILFFYQLIIYFFTTSNYF